MRNDGGRDDLVQRLHALGTEPVGPTLRARHLAQLVPAPARHRLRRRMVLAVVGATVVGGGGLAWAGELPDSAQGVAHRAARSLGVDIPPGHDRVNDVETCGGLDPETGEPYRNHGQYVRDHADDPEAGKSDCGKPRKAVEHPNGIGAESESEDDGPGRGRHLGWTKKGGEESEEPASSLETPTPADHPGEGDGAPPTEVPPQDPGEGEGSPPTSVPPTTADPQ
jgi:hypothetical protein